MSTFPWQSAWVDRQTLFTKEPPRVTESFSERKNSIQGPIWGSCAFGLILRGLCNFSLQWNSKYAKVSESLTQSNKLRDFSFLTSSCLAFPEPEKCHKNPGHSSIHLGPPLTLYWTTFRKRICIGLELKLANFMRNKPRVFMVEIRP